MRFEVISKADHLGSVSIYDVRRALELDSGLGMTTLAKDEAGVQRISREAIAEIEQKMAIVLPIRNEDLKVFEGVLSGIPHDCLMIVISNSGGEGVDIFKSEKDIINRFCEVTKRQALVVHQKDEALAQAFCLADYTDIIGDDEFIRDGKSEGMIISIVLAALMGKDYIGFIDTDNYIPGAVLEYVRHYATGFSLVKSPYSMVRILWHYKPKIIGELYFKRWGRVSETSNRFLNALLSTKGKFETEIIKTANAGEHAMSLELALRLNYGSSYAVETQELISILEQFGGILPVTDERVAEKGVEIIQTESINPHIHAEKGDEHIIQEMLMPSLSVIYHSPLCEDSTKETIREQLVELGCLKEDEPVPRISLISPPQNVNLPVFAKTIEGEVSRYTVPEKAVFMIYGVKKKKAEVAKKVVITDLDGTLLQSLTYSYTAALDAVRKLQAQEIPIVFCSAKTRQEQQAYRDELGITAPFIIENGGALYVPKDYFHLPFSYDKALTDFFVVEFGMPYSELRHRLGLALDATCRQLENNPKLGGISINSFGDMSEEDIAKETGLSLKLASFAKQREYSETLKIEGSQRAIETLRNEISKVGLLCIHGGKFYEVTGGNDKGKAVKVLLEIYKLNYGNVKSFGIGDGVDDLSLLANVDHPMLVQGTDKRWQKLNIRNLQRVKGIGPEGWSRAMDLVLSNL
jgi:mannosyl-3-phosphoglycerate synthase